MADRRNICEARPRAESKRRLSNAFLALKREHPDMPTDELLRLTLKKVKAVRGAGMHPWAQWHIAVEQFCDVVKRAYK
jgi:hypothetical protein